MAIDRAATTTTAILLAVRRALGETGNLNSARAEIEDVLRDDYYDIDRTVAADRAVDESSQVRCLACSATEPRATFLDGFFKSQQSQLEFLRRQASPPDASGNNGDERSPKS